MIAHTKNVNFALYARVIDQPYDELESAVHSIAPDVKRVLERASATTINKGVPAFPANL